ncbi:hypothetical protein [Reyranella sp.]|uniref:hypothetical protein n=1 Tax=Reyranella sp. TaxID=1929291 RepID=UPI003D0FD8AF
MTDEPKKEKKPGIPTGNAGEYFVMGELLRRGFDAQLADRNTQHYDILVGQRGSRNFKPIQVKSVMASPWLLSRASISGVNGDILTIYVLVGDQRAHKPIRYFMAKGGQVAAYAKGPESWKNHTSLNLKALEPFENQWDTVRAYAEPVPSGVLSTG